MNNYIGHYSQVSRIEKHTINEGKAKNYSILEIDNGKGLFCVISLERGGDIARVSCSGINCGYFSPCGYVSSPYYDHVGNGFLKSFTAGFLTTCGLYSVGSPCVDNGENLPLHGSINNTPVDYYNYEESDTEFIINLFINSASFGAYKLIMRRKYVISKKENSITLSDTIENIGNLVTPCMVLYHTNIGYPLLCENSILEINSDSVIPRNEIAKKDQRNYLKIEKPKTNFIEKCYFHEFSKDPKVSIYNETLDLGLKIEMDNNNLIYFTQWRNFGIRDYVLGLEPGNCLPIGRDIMREKGILKELNMGEIVNYSIKFEFFKKKEK